MKEIWKDIKDYEGIYQISNLGNVKVLDRKVWNSKVLHTRRGRIFKLNKNTRGYINIHLTKDGETKNYTVHRLVAENFIPNPLNLPQVNHKDGNKANNILTNLEWVTEKENIQHAYKNNLIKQAQKVIKLDKYSGIELCKYNSAHEASTIEKIDETSIRRCCNNIRKSAGGYFWKYI